MDRYTLIESIVERLCVLFNREPCDVLMDIWEKALVDVSLTGILRGENRVFKEYTGSFMPTPAQFIEFTQITEKEKLGKILEFKHSSNSVPMPEKVRKEFERLLEGMECTTK